MAIVIALTVVAAGKCFGCLGTFPLRSDCSWLTAARGSLIGGTIGKGLVAALLAQIIADKGMLTTLKRA